MNMQAGQPSATTVTISQFTQRNIPEDLKLHPTNFNSTSVSD